MSGVIAVGVVGVALVIVVGEAVAVEVVVDGVLVVIVELVKADESKVVVAVGVEIDVPTVDGLVVGTVEVLVEVVEGVVAELVNAAVEEELVVLGMGVVESHHIKGLGELALKVDVGDEGTLEEP